MLGKKLGYTIESGSVEEEEFYKLYRIRFAANPIHISNNYIKQDFVDKHIDEIIAYGKKYNKNTSHLTGEEQFTITGNIQVESVSDAKYTYNRLKRKLKTFDVNVVINYDNEIIEYEGFDENASWEVTGPKSIEAEVKRILDTW